MQLPKQQNTQGPDRLPFQNRKTHRVLTDSPSKTVTAKIEKKTPNKSNKQKPGLIKDFKSRKCAHVCLPEHKYFLLELLSPRVQ